MNYYYFKYVGNKIIFFLSTILDIYFKTKQNVTDRGKKYGCGNEGYSSYFVSRFYG